MDKIKRETAGCWGIAIIRTIISAMGKRVSHSFPDKFEDIYSACVSLPDFSEMKIFLDRHLHDSTNRKLPMPKG